MIKNQLSLASIVSTFEKNLRRLEAFQEKNAKQITKMQNELHVKEREQERAQNIANNIKEFLDGRDDAERVPEESK